MNVVGVEPHQVVDGVHHLDEPLGINRWNCQPPETEECE
jgi:hypothetical protein